MKNINLFFARYFAGKLQDPDAFIEELKAQRHRDMGPDTSAERFFETLEDIPMRQAVERIRAGKIYFTSEPYLRQHERADWQYTDPRIQAFAARMIEAARRQGVPLYVHGAFRTQAEQETMLYKGTSKAAFPRAPHCQGKAVDIVHARYHWELTRTEWEWLGKLGKDLAQKMSLKVTWGGDWSSIWDPAHWELTDWRDDIRIIVASDPIRKTPKRLLQETKGL